MEAQIIQVLQLENKEVIKNTQPVILAHNLFVIILLFLDYSTTL